MIRFLLVLIVLCFLNTCTEVHAQCAPGNCGIFPAVKQRVEKTRTRTRTTLRKINIFR